MEKDLDGLFALGFVKDGIETIEECDGIVFECFEPGANEKLDGFGVGGGTALSWW